MRQLTLTNTTFGLIKSIEGNILKGKTIKTKPFWMELEEECTRDKIGVFLFDGESENKFNIEKKEVFGKALLVNGVILSAPKVILDEKY